jgi:hypothetical protein
VGVEKIKQEFKLSYYGERFNTTLECVIKALFGHKDKHKYIGR